jgi:hypothetical protein
VKAALVLGRHQTFRGEPRQRFTHRAEAHREASGQSGDQELFARLQPAGQDLGAQSREYGGRQAPDGPAVVGLPDEQIVACHRADGRDSTHFCTTPRDYSAR